MSNQEVFLNVWDNIYTLVVAQKCARNKKMTYDVNFAQNRQTGNKGNQAPKKMALPVHIKNIKIFWVLNTFLELKNDPESLRSEAEL